MNMKKLLLLVLLLLSVKAMAQYPLLRLPAIYSDHAILQQDSEIKIWGWSSPRTKVKVIPSWSNDTIVTETMSSAKWETLIRTPSAGGPYKIEIVGFNKSITIQDVAIGELWLCGGQSNMEWSASRVTDGKEAIPNSANDQIRFFMIDKSRSDYPQEDLPGRWFVCSPESLKNFSALGYFFGKNLQDALQVPIGLLNANWGGTSIETWTPQQDLDPSKEWDKKIGATYNTMIHPLIDIKLAGVIWYQGEANCHNAYEYSKLQTTLMNRWREKFQNDFPFYYVQIAPYGRYNVPFSAAVLREQQEKVMSLTNKTGMVVISDQVDEINNIHPNYKKEVGNRLSNWALAETYGKPTAKYKHATCSKTKISKNTIQIFFDNAESGLVIKGKEIVGLEIAGDDGIFYEAIGKIDKKTNSLLAEAKKVKLPVYVRYCFSNDAIGNLFDASGLPVAPFRTDSLRINLSEPKISK